MNVRKKHEGPSQTCPSLGSKQIIRKHMNEIRISHQFAIIVIEIVLVHPFALSEVTLIIRYNITIDKRLILLHFETNL